MLWFLVLADSVDDEYGSLALVKSIDFILPRVNYAKYIIVELVKYLAL